MKAVILARVSTSHQDYTRQISELKEYASKHCIEIVEIFANKVSGAKQIEERKEIIDLISFVKENRVDKVMVLEISRLGRNTLESLKIIELLNQNKISLFIKNYNIETLNANGEINPMAQFMATLLLEFSSMERMTIRQRILSGYENFRNNGGKVGRKVGYKKKPEKMKDEYKDEIRLLRKGLSLRDTSKMTGTSINTLQKIKKMDLV